MSKQEKLRYLESRLVMDDRCYSNMKNKDRGPPVGYAGIWKERLDVAMNANIHPGLIIKLVYWNVTKDKGFRYHYHNQLFRKDIIEAMGPIRSSINGKADQSFVNKQLSTVCAANALNSPAATTSQLSVSPQAGGSPLKLTLKKIKRELDGSMGRVAGGSHLGSFGGSTSASGHHSGATAATQTVIDSVTDLTKAQCPNSVR